MAEVLVDSGFWIALFRHPRGSREPDRHEQALATAERLTAERVSLVTTNLVVAETHQLMLVRGLRRHGVEFLHRVRAPGVLVIDSAARLEERAVAEWIDRFRDHDFSLCDAVSFVVMRERGIRQALTFDRHFAAAGFEMLPAPERPPARR